MSNPIFMTKRRKRVTDLYRDVFSTENGRAVLEDLMKRSNVLEGTFDSGMDALELARREGKREAVLFIITQIGLSLSDVVTISHRIIENQVNPEGEEAYGR